MFAVSGWSVSANALKTQAEFPKKSPSHVLEPKESDNASKSSRKRKRGHNQNRAPAVTVENLADLWENHIEKRAVNRRNTDAEANTQPKRKRSGRRKEGQIRPMPQTLYTIMPNYKTHAEIVTGLHP